jgi:hypothetical protein
MRSRVEVGLRLLALGGILGWVILALRPRSQVQVVDSAALAQALPRWTTGRVDSVHVLLDTVPDDLRLAWLAALRSAGIGATYDGVIAPLGVEAFASPAPAGGAVVLTAAPGGVLSDALGAIDTLAGGDTPAQRATAVRVGDVQGQVMLTAGKQPARAVVTPARVPKRLFVVAAAGWEAKFLIAALEESGWRVDARLLVGPGQDVWQGARTSLDTSRHAAALVLDSIGAAAVTGVERFARDGGGVVIAGDANRALRLTPLMAWRAGRRAAAPLGTLPADTLWRGLGRVVLENVADDRAVVLEERQGSATVVARRYYAGRVVAVGFDETWRWRMAGDGNSLTAHRDWWSRLVASVALRAPAAADAPPSGAAPRARLHDALGPATSTTRTPPRLPSGLLGNVLGAIALAALLAEWLLRRLRGAR